MARFWPLLFRIHLVLAILFPIINAFLTILKDHHSSSTMPPRGRPRGRPRNSAAELGDSGARIGLNSGHGGMEQTSGLSNTGYSVFSINSDTPSSTLSLNSANVSQSECTTSLNMSQQPPVTLMQLPGLGANGIPRCATCWTPLPTELLHPRYWPSPNVINLDPKLSYYWDTTKRTIVVTMRTLGYPIRWIMSLTGVPERTIYVRSLPSTYD